MDHVLPWNEVICHGGNTVVNSVNNEITDNANNDNNKLEKKITFILFNFVVLFLVLCLI